MMKKALFFLVAMIASVSVWADPLGSLTLGENNLNLPGEDGTSLSYDYTFTPTEEGTYRIWSESATSLGYGAVQCYVILYGGLVFYDDEPTEGHFDCQGELTANVDYSILFIVSNQVGDITVHIERVDNNNPDPDPIVLTLGDNTVAFTEGQTLIASFTPIVNGYYRFYSAGDVVRTQITVKEGDTPIKLDIDGSDENNFDIVAKLTSGTTYTVELYSNSGTSDVTVTIFKMLSPAPSVLSLGDNTIPFRESQETRVPFVPDVSGDYRFTSTGTVVDTKIIIMDTGFNVISTDDDSGDGNNFDCTQTLTGGTTYIIGFYSNSGTDDVTVTVENVAAGATVVSYIDENRETQRRVAIVLTGDETWLGEDEQESWYVAQDILNYTRTLNIAGDVHLILADGCTMTVNVKYESYGIYLNGDLTIYAQTSGTGKLNAYGDNEAISYYDENNDLTINGGTINATGSNFGICLTGNLTINNSTVSASGTDKLVGVGITCGDLTINNSTVSANGIAGIDIYGSITLNGGSITGTGTDIGIAAQETITINNGTIEATATGPGSDVNAIYGYNGVIVNGGIVSATGDIGICSIEGNIILGYTSAMDSIYVSNFYVEDGEVCIADGQAFTDGDNIYDSMTPSAILAALTNVTLHPVATFAISQPESFEHGMVTCDKQSAYEGQTVTLTVTPDNGYELENIAVTIAGETEPSGAPKRLRGGSVELTQGTEPNTYTFQMPAAPVTVNASFKEATITGVEDINAVLPKSGQRYNLMGQPVGKDYKGIVIEVGKKRVIK